MRRPSLLQHGFTLVELAVVLAIVGLLMGSLMYTLSAQTEQRRLEDTRRRLEQARELLLSYAIVNGRLPCPAVCTDYPTCSAGGTESIQTPFGSGTGGTCNTAVGYGGYLPAMTIGYTYTDSNGYGLDAYGNRIRYAVSRTNEPHFTSNVALKTNGITVLPADLYICKHLTATNQTTCGGPANQVVNADTVAAVLWSQGKNFAASGAASIDEGNNNDAAAAFVSRTPTGSDSADGEFDDILTWIPVATLYGRMVAAGVLP